MHIYIYRIFPDIRFVLPTGFPPKLWHFASLELSQYANACLWQPVWSLSLKGDRIYTVQRSSIVALHNTSPTWLENGAGLLPWDGISLVWLGRKFIYSPPPPHRRVGPVHARVRCRDTHVLEGVKRGTEDKQQQEKTRRGKHSWLPLSLLTPAVGCNLHSNRTWKHCAELIFEVVIFNNPPLLSIFFNCSILWKLISQWWSLLTNNLWHHVKENDSIKINDY